MHDRNTNSEQKRQSHCVVYEKQNQIIFPLHLERNNTLKQWWIGCFLTLKVYCTYSNNGKNIKITLTVVAVTKHLAKFQIKKLYRRKVITVFISPGPRQHFCFSTLSENAHAFSCTLPVVK